MNYRQYLIGVGQATKTLSFLTSTVQVAHLKPILWTGIKLATDGSSNTLLTHTVADVPK